MTPYEATGICEGFIECKDESKIIEAIQSRCTIFIECNRYLLLPIPCVSQCNYSMAHRGKNQSCGETSGLELETRKETIATLMREMPRTLDPVQYKLNNPAIAIRPENIWLIKSCMYERYHKEPS